MVAQNMVFENARLYSFEKAKGKNLHEKAAETNGKLLATRMNSEWKVSSLKAEELAYLYVKHKGQCQSCFGELTSGSHSDLHVDHIIPRSITNCHGRTKHMKWDLNNLTLLCESCNCSKGKRIGEGHAFIYQSNDTGETRGYTRARQIPGFTRVHNGDRIAEILKEHDEMKAKEKKRKEKEEKMKREERKRKKKEGRGREMGMQQSFIKKHFKKQVFEISDRSENGIWSKKDGDLFKRNVELATGLSPGTLNEPGEDRETFLDALTDMILSRGAEGEEDVDSSTWNKQELCDWLEEHGLPVDGGKPVLVWRVKKVMQLNKWKKQDLRDWLREREVRRNGDKGALVARVTRMEELNAYSTVQELRDWLRVRGLPLSGARDELVARVAREEGY